MLGALNLPTAGISLSETPFPFSGDSQLRSNRPMSFSTACRAAAASPAVESAPAAVDSRRRDAAGGSLYSVLRVRPGASAGEIKAAYRTLAKVYHPDAAAGAGAGGSDGRDFIAIRDAYATLSDPTARTLYDLSLGLATQRARRPAAAARSGRYPTKRWETDQCW